MADAGLEDGVMFLQSIGPDLSRQKCIDILKHYNNDVNTAVNKVMDGQYENEMKVCLQDTEARLHWALGALLYPTTTLVELCLTCWSASNAQYI